MPGQTHLHKGQRCFGRYTLLGCGPFPRRCAKKEDEGWVGEERATKPAGTLARVSAASSLFISRAAVGQSRASSSPTEGGRFRFRPATPTIGRALPPLSAPASRLRSPCVTVRLTRKLRAPPPLRLQQEEEDEEDDDEGPDTLPPGPPGSLGAGRTSWRTPQWAPAGPRGSHGVGRRPRRGAPPADSEPARSRQDGRRPAAAAAAAPCWGPGVVSTSGPIWNIVLLSLPTLVRSPWLQIMPMVIHLDERTQEEAVVACSSDVTQAGQWKSLNEQTRVCVMDKRSCGNANSVTLPETLLFVSTLDGSFHAVSKRTGSVKWTLKEDPVLQVPLQMEDPRPAFLPDPNDGSLYTLGGQNNEGLTKLPFTIPELVHASPCRSSDGILYMGKKQDSWYVVDLATGEKQQTLTSSFAESLCPSTSLLYLGRTEYTITMYDTKSKELRWNATYFNYAATLPDDEVQYKMSHFASNGDGLVVTVDSESGDVLWIQNYGSPVVAFYIWQREGLWKVMHTNVGIETLPYLTFLSGEAGRITKWKYPFPKEAESKSKLLPTLYVGKHSTGLYASPSMVHEGVAIMPRGSPIPLIEGPKTHGVTIEECVITPSTDVKFPSEFKQKNSLRFLRNHWLLIGHHETPLSASTKILEKFPRNLPRRHENVIPAESDKAAFEEAIDITGSSARNMPPSMPENPGESLSQTSARPEAPVDSMLKDVATVVLSTVLLVGWVALVITYPMSVHHQQQRQQQQFQRQLEEKIQMLKQQPFSPPTDLPPEGEFLDGSGIRPEGSATSSPNISPKASNHSAYSSVSASEVGSCLSTEQEEEMTVGPIHLLCSKPCLNPHIEALWHRWARMDRTLRVILTPRVSNVGRPPCHATAFDPELRYASPPLHL
ncbi:hypothetical protein JRQ81_004144 [Phrynocephalus forsythii]|uniref:Uncharacterized protein n=1 Tax=Phrynocephalus forsythii TaxID=171643 RepID=A0A9Q0XPC9_9SAUR|nr:hypothetical protein JRQ81_004144 [Phrynocephalus forsythii]